jgi:competence protein CoiA
MKFALTDGQRQEAQPNLSAECPGCGAPMVAKCGEVRIRHWAHKGQRVCDRWWENETEWHRGWKDQFPADWQEVVHHAPDGERHIADVKTQNGWVLEFQHSKIKPDERRSRESFYHSLIWVIDGRRERDAVNFLKAWAKGEARDPLSSQRRLTSPASALLKNWAGSSVHVFFDLGESLPLWWLFPEGNDSRSYVQYVSRSMFVRIHREQGTLGLSEFDSLVQNFNAFVALYESPPPTLRPQRPREISLPLPHRPIVRRSFRF